MLDAANWTARLNELAAEANVPGAALGIWSDGQEILAAHGDLLLYPAEATDSSGARFVLRSGDDEPWAPVSFDRLADGTPYLYMSGRVAPRVG